MSLNRWQGIGNLGRDPEQNFLPSGDTVVNFSIAITEKYTTKAGEKKENTEWVSIATFGKLADIAFKWLKKGQQVYVEGKLKIDKYEKDGQTRYSYRIVATGLEMIGGKKTEEQPKYEAKANQAIDDFEDEKLPF